MFRSGDVKLFIFTVKVIVYLLNKQLICLDNSHMHECTIKMSILCMNECTIKMCILCMNIL